MEAPALTFWKSCPELTPREVPVQSEMIAQAVEVTYRTFRRRVGAEELDRWASEHGYDVGSERGGLRLSADWHVAYYRSTWAGSPCYYLV